jgi:hypothetical protein
LPPKADINCVGWHVGYGNVFTCDKGHDGVGTTTQSARTPRLVTDHQHRRYSRLPSPRGRLRYVNRLRRRHWRIRQISTNIPSGPLNEGCPIAAEKNGHWRSESDVMRCLMPRWAVFIFLSFLSFPGAKAQVNPAMGTSSGSGAEKGETQSSLCLLLESAARANDLPVNFFVRLIWRESRFRSNAVGPKTRGGKRALGIAQFMPGTAAERDLLDPMNPMDALPKAAEFLRDLRRQFGNLGLAAAAYNAGPTRVREWLAGKRSVPSQTRAYVHAVTGVTIDEWSKGKGVHHQPSKLTCDKAVALLKSTPTTFVAALERRVVAGVLKPWGAILGASNSRSKILARYATLQHRYAPVLAGRDPILLERRRGPLPRYQVRVGTDTRAAANDLCRHIHKSGGDCVVLRNPRS